MFSNNTVDHSNKNIYTDACKIFKYHVVLKLISGNKTTGMYHAQSQGKHYIYNVV